MNLEVARPFKKLPGISEGNIVKHLAYQGTLSAQLAELLKSLPSHPDDLRTLIETSEGVVQTTASLVWAHQFYWQSMTAKPRSVELEGAELRETFFAKCEKDFGSFEEMKTALLEASITLLGSGFVWLVEHNNEVSVMKTKGAEVPLTVGKKPLIGIDLWEHAYLPDFGYNRVAYVTHFLDKLVDWDFAAQNLARRS